MEYLLHLLILVGIYVMLSQSLNLSAGFGGMISLAHAGFYGVGAYTAALLSVNYHLPFLMTLPVAMLLSGLLALIVSAIALRTIDDYFIICTLGIQVIVFSLMNNWMSLTRGPLGIPGIPEIQLFGIAIESKWAFLLLTFIFVALIFFFLKKLTGSSFGRTLRGLREDEIFAQSLGKNVYLSKVIAFTAGAMIAAIPGVLYAHYISYIDPTSFTVDESIFILSIVIIGGMQNLWGSVLAAAFLVLLPEALRFVGMPNAIAANMRQIIYGGILIFTMFRYSKGFVSKV
ncbi:MAG: branched-chain amino acid transport system permease protein [Candidatus Ordinivivax streblomastigis]|uniref:Branched-chain amino acid transport system permease protein n=1 Tax=Candidatus Ordinivivax streblomastigis TaxID=2540710 RepID=A0A5M8NZ64_9BACT|nr:MAG: branched-chain amino acid transport system permease protein [Candidatus Ordinivivax streblomastigis]